MHGENHDPCVTWIEKIGFFDHCSDSHPLLINPPSVHFSQKKKSHFLDWHLTTIKPWFLPPTKTQSPAKKRRLQQHKHKLSTGWGNHYMTFVLWNGADLLSNQQIFISETFHLLKHFVPKLAHPPAAIESVKSRDLNHLLPGWLRPCPEHSPWK